MKKLVNLDVECREDGRKQTRLRGTKSLGLFTPVSRRERAHVNEEVVHVLLPSSYKLIVVGLNSLRVRFPHLGLLLGCEFVFGLLFKLLSQILRHSSKQRSKSVCLENENYSHRSEAAQNPPFPGALEILKKSVQQLP